MNIYPSARWLTVSRRTKKIFSVVLGSVWCICCYHWFNISTSVRENARTQSRLLMIDQFSLTSSFAPATTVEVPSVDKSPKLSEEEIKADIQDHLHNLPIIFWQENQKFGLSKNESCAKFPSIYDITYNNIYWQFLETINGSFYLYGAYYDNRKLESMKPVIRILGMVNRVDLTVKTYCQLWFSGSREPAFAPVYEYKWIWIEGFGKKSEGTLLNPYLMSCKIPREYRHLVPEAVSLVERPCDMTTTLLRVFNNYPPMGGKKGDFSVCVKGMNFPYDDLSVRLIEWFELLYQLGADKIFMYDIAVHPNVSKVLSHYDKQERFELSKLTIPGLQPNGQGLSYLLQRERVFTAYRNELIPYNDCLYRSINKFKYVVLLDIDEVIMPRNVSTWNDLMNVMIDKARQENRDRRSSYAARNVYFMDSMRQSRGWRPKVPKYLHMLQNVYRSSNYTAPGAFVKCFHDTEVVLTLHNHFPFSCIGKGCFNYDINTKDAHLQHYRNNCVSELAPICSSMFKNRTEFDPSILRYQESLVRNVLRTLRQLGFLKTQDEAH